MTALLTEELLGGSGEINSSGLDPAVEEIRALSFGEISWPMSGNNAIAEVVC